MYQSKKNLIIQYNIFLKRQNKKIINLNYISSAFFLLQKWDCLIKHLKIIIFKTTEHNAKNTQPESRLDFQFRIFKSGTHYIIDNNFLPLRKRNAFHKQPQRCPSFCFDITPIPPTSPNTKHMSCTLITLENSPFKVYGCCSVHTNWAVCICVCFERTEREKWDRWT